MSRDCQRCDGPSDSGKIYCDACWTEIEAERVARPIARAVIERFAGRLAEELRAEAAGVADWKPETAAIYRCVAAVVERAVSEESS